MEEAKTTTEKYADILCELLAARLFFSKTWKQVDFEHTNGKYLIKWYDSKHMDDPYGDKVFREYGGPYTIDGLHQENLKQDTKLAEDER